MYRSTESGPAFSSQHRSSILSSVPPAVQLARLTSRLRSSIHSKASPVTSHLPPPPSFLAPSAALAIGSLQGPPGSRQFHTISTISTMVRGPKLRPCVKRAGAGSMARCFCSCYARNVNACWAFLKRAGGFVFFTATLAFQACPDIEGSEKIQARESAAVRSA